MRATTEPVRRRIVAWYIATIGIIAVLLTVIVYSRVTHEIEEVMEERLRAAVREASRTVRLHAAAGNDLATAAALALEELQQPDLRLRVYRADGRVLAPGGLAAPAAGLVAQAVADGEATTTLLVESVRWPARAKRTVSGQDTVVVIAAADPATARIGHGGLLDVLGFTGLASLVLAGAAGLLLLRVSLRPIEDVFQYRQRFLTEAAHELRTPVAVLRGSLDVALSAGRDPEQDAQVLRAAAREVARLGRLVDDLFFLVRVEAGERPLRSEPCFLDDIVSEAFAAATVLAQERGTRLEFGEYEEAPVRGDPDLLGQLALALIDNALKFTPAGGVVRVSVGSGGEHAHLVVDDSGPGIAEADRARIFERFYRSRSARATAPGAGLGLTIVRWIADAHHATVVVSTSPTGGARFAVRMPVRTAARATRAARTAAARGEAGGADAAGKEGAAGATARQG